MKTHQTGRSACLINGTSAAVFQAARQLCKTVLTVTNRKSGDKPVLLPDIQGSFTHHQNSNACSLASQDCLSALIVINLVPKSVRRIQRIYVVSVVLRFRKRAKQKISDRQIKAICDRCECIDAKVGRGRNHIIILRN